MKITRSEEDFKAQLREQLEFLKTSADNFDKGNESEAKRIATHIRILMHDTENSTSLLMSLGVKDKLEYMDSAFDQTSFGESYTGLVIKSVGPKGGRYVAPLDNFPPNHVYKKVSFEDYWNKEVFQDTKGNKFSRKDLVLALANKDGGAHVDEELNQDYVELTRQNSLGWTYESAGASGPFGNASLPAVRQIGHEILKTLIPDYPEKKAMVDAGAVMMGPIMLEKDFVPGYLTGMQTGGKENKDAPCPCGSGRNYRNCGYIKSQTHLERTMGR